MVDGMALFVGLLVWAASFSFWIALVPEPAVKVTQDQLRLRGEMLLITEESELRAPFTQRVLVPLAQNLLRRVGSWVPPRNIQRLHHDLAVAGNPGGLTVMEFMGLRLLSGVVAGGIGFLGFLAGSRSTRGLVFMVVLGILGFYLPNFWLKRRMSARQNEILRALPDALDMLTIAVDAGLGFDSALLMIGEKWDHALAQEFNRVVAETRLGKRRRDALRDLADRVDVPDLTNFVAVLVQADQLGMDISRVLHTQAEQLRVRRRQRAEEKAHQAPIKMLFPLVFLIFPAMFIVILGPSAPLFIELFADLARQPTRLF